MRWIAYGGLIWLLATAAVSAQEKKAEMKVEIVVNADTGWPEKINITGQVFVSNAWLGISLYPYGVVDPITGGRHSYVTLTKGRFSQEITVDNSLLGGSFEVAVWGKKVDKVDCTRDYDYWCKKFGFHLEELLVYKSGLLTRLTGYK